METIILKQCTVGQLIQALKDMPEDALVVVPHEVCDFDGSDVQIEYCEYQKDGKTTKEVDIFLEREI